MSKLYQVFVTDEYNNNYLLGFYNNLDDSINEINDYIQEDKYKLQKGDLKEYTSTFGTCFDTCLYDILLSKYGDEFEDCNIDTSMYIRGFIFDKDNLINYLEEL